MTIDELKKKIADYRSKLKGESGKIVTSSDNGPIGLKVIDDVVAAMEALEKRIAALEKPTEKPTETWPEGLTPPQRSND
jgi:hypothetical protein